MHPANLLSEIQQLFPAKDSAHFLAGLRQDPLVWASLQSPEVFEKLTTVTKAEIELGEMPWTPARIALLEISSPQTPADLSQNPMPPVEEDLLKKALSAYENVNKNGQMPGSLAEAGLIAIALRERRRLKPSWDGLVKEISNGGSQKGRSQLMLWRTPLAVLYGIVPEPQELIRALIQERSFWPIYSLVSHILLCNAYQIELQTNVFYDLIRETPVAQQLEFLRNLNLFGRNNLVERLSNRLLGQQQAVTVLATSHWINGMSPERLMSRALELQQMSNLYRLAGKLDQAEIHLHSALDALRSILAGMEVQLAETSFAHGENDNAYAGIDQAMKALPGSAQVQGELALVLQDDNHARSLLKQLSLEESHPFAQIRKAGVLFENGEKEQAIETAKNAINNLVEDYCENHQAVALKLAFDWHPALVLSVLMKLGLDHEALQIGLMILESRPSDVKVINALSGILDELGDLPEALGYARTAVILDPENVELHRRLAGLYEKNGEIQSAYAESEQIIKSQREPLAEDWIELSRRAFQLHQYNRALEACKTVLDQQPNNPAAVMLMGKTLMALDQNDQAAAYLSRASLLKPDDPEIWMSLAACYQKSGKPQRAIEVLRSAVLAVPDSAEINFALGDSYLGNGSLAEGLPFLRKAAELSPQSIDCAIRLGETLVTLGYIHEAENVLEKARQRWVLEPRLAYLHAKILIALGEREAALPALEIALQIPEPGFELYLLYAQTLLGENNIFLTSQPGVAYASLVNAQQALEKALIIEPEHFPARLLMAEILGARENYQTAFNVYRRLVEEPEKEEPNLKWRVVGGFGLAALKLNQVETALAALREAVDAGPTNVFLHRTLAEACWIAKLRSEALDTARNALSMAPDRIENLQWFANLMIVMGEQDEAIHALSCAAQLAPEEPEYLIQLAELQLQAGDSALAGRTLGLLQDLPGVTSEHLRRAARLFLKLDENEGALHALENAAKLDKTANAELALVLSCIHVKKGDVKTALEYLQTAIEAKPEDYSLHVFQSDLLSVSGKIQAATACLEHAIQLHKASPLQTTSFSYVSDWVDNLLPESWLRSLVDEAGLYMRMAALLRQTGEIETACEHLENALGQFPDNLTLKYMTADANMAILKNDRAKQIINSVVAADDSEHRYFFDEKNPDQFAGWQLLSCLAGELALSMGNWEEAKRIDDVLTSLSSTDPRMNALHARYLGSVGQVVDAKAAYQQARNLYLKAATNSEYLPITPISSFDLAEKWGRMESAWIAESAAAAGMWDEALEFARAGEQSLTHEPRVHLTKAKLIVRQAETARVAQELDVMNNIPAGDACGMERAQELEQALESAGVIGDHQEISRWRCRGEIAFQPSQQAIRAFIDECQSPEDHAALVWALHRLENHEAAIQISQKYGEEPSVLVPASLSYMSVDPQKAFEISWEVAIKQRENPLALATAAKTAFKAGETKHAIEAIEAALQIWPEESAWHMNAADYYLAAGKSERRLEHMEKAVQGMSGHTPYLLKFAKACLENGIYEKTIELMDSAERVTPDDPEIWNLTAKAYLKLGNYKKAIEFAEHAAVLAPENGTSYAISAEAALAEGKYEKAITFVSSGLANEPDNVDLILLHSKILVREGKPREAIKTIDQSLPGKKNALPLLYERAKLVKQLDGAQAALPYAGELVRLHPEKPETLIFLAHTQKELGNVAESEQIARRAYQLAPEDASLNLLLGKLYHEKGQLDHAVHFLSESIRLSKNAEAYLELAKTQLDRRETNLAIQTLQQAMKTNVNDVRPYVASAHIYRDIKDYTSAEAMLRKAAQIDPEDLNIRRQLSAIIALNLVNNSREVPTK